MQTFSYDVVIVGGGIVGQTLALSLAQNTTLSIALLEATSALTPWSLSSYSHRVSAIALSSQRIFQALQVWDTMRKRRVSPFKQIEVWDSVKKAEIQFAASDIAEPLLGHIIENNLIQASLAEKIKQQSQITYIAPLKLKELIEQEQGATLITEEGSAFKAELMVAADGANSWLRREAKILVNRYDYQQEAIVATVRTSQPHGQIARQTFLETGPLAFLPLVDEYTASIVWSLPERNAQSLMELSNLLFQQALAQAFSHRLGEVTEVSQRFTFPLYKQQTNAYVKSRVVLVGDAAHTIHPLAGLGVNMGLLDAACLSQLIEEALRARLPFTSSAILRRYERWRKADNFSLLRGVDLIHSLFTTDKPSIQRFRSLGLNATNHIKWIKNLLVRHAVGDRLGLPKAAKI